MSEKYKEFEVATVALEGANLIEASAGTGKTFSINILVLRLLLEKQMPLNKILMVTFTDAAVSELKGRIRQGIRDAYLFALQLSQAPADSELFNSKDISENIVLQAFRNENIDVIEVLHDNLQLIDEAQICTIHSFCQSTLNEFAFETNQPFGLQLQTDVEAETNQILNDFWRTKVTTLPVEILKLLKMLANLADVSDLKSKILALVNSQLGGKPFYRFQEIEEDDLSKLLTNCALGVPSDPIETAFYQDVEQEPERFIGLVDGLSIRNKDEKETLKTLVRNSIPQFWASVIARWAKTKTFQTTFSEYKERYDAEQNRRKEANDSFLNTFYSFAIQYIVSRIENYVASHNLLTYNNMIVNLYQALKFGEKREALATKMSEKFDAVFIDEFQDTDNQQYFIFKTAFADKGNLTFYIGDPKQSIYAFRKADVYTYFEARKAVGERLYSMKTNHRSSAHILKAMNHYFLPTEDFDTFFFADESESIQYQKVDASPRGEKLHFLHGEEEEAPISLLSSETKPELAEGVVQQVNALLSDPSFRIQKEGEARPISEKDIAILVRINNDARDVKKALSQLGIRSVVQDDGKILSSPEAKELLFILTAVWENSMNNIRRALVTSLINYSIDDLQRVDEESIISIVRDYRSLWLSQGIYSMLSRLMRDFAIQDRLLAMPGGERMLANLEQLAEVLNEQVHYEGRSPEDLINWLHRGIEGEKVDGDQYELRLESDRDAVQIMTIHKSKGLEFNIVFVLGLDNPAALPKNFETASFGKPNDETSLMEYFTDFTTSINNDPLLQAIAVRQLEQENRRLLYVAVTRAVYKCYLYRKSKGVGVNCLSVFEEAMNANPEPSLIEIKQIELEENQSDAKRIFAGKVKLSKAKDASSFQLAFEDWKRLSYSRIAAHGEYIPKERTQDKLSDFEDFILNKLRAGAMTGTMLHNLLERIDFQNEEYWSEVYGRISVGYPNASDESFSAHIFQLLRYVVSAPLHFGQEAESFSLQDVSRQKRLSELEFDFPLQQFKLSELQNLLDRSRMTLAVLDNDKIEGLMNGIVDLFFEHQGKYYIIDWKSNYLGYKMENYSAENLDLAMSENNYHLQYLIYTIAMRKFLQSRLPNFDYVRDFGGVAYVFLRGIRPDSNSGIFMTKPDVKLLNEVEALIMG